ncbi:MAG: membrane protein insertion efficiency factor YidD [Candidatus Omnitrophica bacterium]|nr:membrane protein insertion efficiency factor YidD [Candidatus Omnitrophota bacterium]MDD5351608.1 membrane protein insertion efficiency factor YidD [Candidatus Omnitrophota bacterium]MDD5550817.1 membrane protein insertion efficiency factor YidD [Candidatus Omnitrophota bacterium]
MSKIVIKIITAYQIYISPFLGRNCRFHPSCSQYCQEAISQYGLLRGMSKGFTRIIRCHPFSRGGFDPVTK